MSYQAFNDKFEPVVLLGQNLGELDSIDRITPKKVWVVNFIEPLPIFRKDFGNLASGGDSGKIELKEVQVLEDRITQIRFVPLDDLKVELFIGLGNQKYATMESQFFVDRTIMYMNPSLSMTEFWNVKDRTVYMQVTNQSSQAKTKNRVLFTGFHYYVKQIDLSRLTEERRRSLPVTLFPSVAGGS